MVQLLDQLNVPSYFSNYMLFFEYLTMFAIIRRRPALSCCTLIPVKVFIYLYSMFIWFLPHYRKNTFDNSSFMSDEDQIPHHRSFVC